MNEIQILKQHPKKVLESLKLGLIERMELAVEQITDEFMIYGLRGGLIDALSKSFPDPRKECEITFKQILSASMAGQFQDMYALSQSSYLYHHPFRQQLRIPWVTSYKHKWVSFSERRGV